ncbi:MAG: M20/M25/M40 family metallo-hydrolase [Gemmatimonadetes bacterium]|nr:M20/M25/M40 family metallo-hydrolase [Gemmatimonadota bacterium]
MTHRARSAPATLALVSALTWPASATTQDASSDYTEPYQRKALEMYRTGISYRTAVGHGQVPAYANYLAEQFRAGGFPEEDIHVLPYTVPLGEETASLVVRYRGDGSSGERPILLMGHMDIVDALPEDWERDPFTLLEEDGYFFGRGTIDDKFGVTALTATFLRLKAEGFVPTRDLIIGFSGDEETGMLTTRQLVTRHRALTDAEFALNADAGGGSLGDQGEGIAYSIQTAEKTYATFELTLRNPGGHSSTPRADNAIYELATVLKNIEAFRFPVRTNETTIAFFRASADVTPGPVGEAMRRFADNPDDAQAVEVLWGQPSFVGITRTTCVATMLRGGHAENALPQTATATVNCRIFPGVAVEEVRQTLLGGGDNDELEIEVLGDPMASPASQMREDVRSAVASAVESRFPGTAIIPYMAPSATDGREMRAAGIPTYGVMGLFMRSEEIFAHGLNERAPVRSFFEALEHWHTILTQLAGG